jgi:hypothetical protein
MRMLGLLLALAPAAALGAPVARSSKSAQPAAKSARPAAKSAKSARPAAKSAQPAAKSAKSARPAAKSVPAADPTPAPARAARAAARRPAGPEPPGSCTAALTARKVAWKPATRPGIAHGVEITGPLGGVTLSSPSGPLVIDCSLAISLDEAGRYLRNVGIDAVTFSSAYSRRLVRGTNRPSKHSYGLALDVQAFSGPDLGTIAVDRDYEQGLGDSVDCLGHPLTQGGATLKLLQCQLARSGLFYLVLSPDYDDAHHDHFHLEVKPWSERTAVRAATPAVH